MVVATADAVAREAVAENAAAIDQADTAADGASATDADEHDEADEAVATIVEEDTAPTSADAKALRRCPGRLGHSAESGVLRALPTPMTFAPSATSSGSQTKSPAERAYWRMGCTAAPTPSRALGEYGSSPDPAARHGNRTKTGARDAR